MGKVLGYVDKQGREAAFTSIKLSKNCLNGRTVTRGEVLTPLCRIYLSVSKTAFQGPPKLVMCLEVRKVDFLLVFLLFVGLKLVFIAESFVLYLSLLYVQVRDIYFSPHQIKIFPIVTNLF